MKFSCYKDDLAQAIQTAMIAVAQKTSTPVLSGIYLKAEGALLQLQSNDLNKGTIVRIPANVEIDGEIVVSGKRFQSFVKSCPEDTLTAFVEGNEFKIQSGAAEVSLLTMTPSDFPKVKKIDEQGSVTIATSDLKSMLNKTIFAVSTDETRPIFTGVSFTFNGENLIAKATNTHRYSQVTCRLSTSTDIDGQGFCIPANVLRGLISLLNFKDADDSVTLAFAQSQASFTFNNVYLTTRLIEGKFPPTDKLIPESTATNVEVATKAFREVVDFVAIIARDTEYNTIKFDIHPDVIHVFAYSKDIGEATRSIDAKVEGDDLCIAFNANYLADVLKVVEAPTVKIGFNGKFDPMRVLDPDSENFIHIVTPVRA